MSAMFRKSYSLTGEFYNMLNESKLIVKILFATMKETIIFI